MITIQRLQQLLSSAKANKRETEEILMRYDGAIQTLQMLIDDLRAEEIKELAEQQEPERVETGVVVGGEGGADTPPPYDKED